MDIEEYTWHGNRTKNEVCATNRDAKRSREKKSWSSSMDSELKVEFQSGEVYLSNSDCTASENACRGGLYGAERGSRALEEPSSSTQEAITSMSESD